MLLLKLTWNSVLSFFDFFSDSDCEFPAFVDSGNQFCIESLTFSSTKELGQAETSYLQSIKNILQIIVLSYRFKALAKKLLSVSFCGPKQTAL